MVGFKSLYFGMLFINIIGCSSETDNSFKSSVFNKPKYILGNENVNLALGNSRLDTSAVQGIGQCALQCLNTRSCMSFNYKKSGNGNLNCELNYSKVGNSMDLVVKIGFSHYVMMHKVPEDEMCTTAEGSTTVESSTPYLINRNISMIELWPDFNLTISGIGGSWMMDTVYESDTVYIINGDHNCAGMTVFPSIQELIQDALEIKPLKRRRKKRKGTSNPIYASPNSLSLSLIGNECDGTGHVIYNNILYCNFHVTGGDPVIQSVDLRNWEAVANLSTELTEPAGIGAHDKFPYKQRNVINTDIDFAVDEYSMWLVYATDSSNLVLSKVDPETLTLDMNMTYTFTEVAKTQVAQTFMIDGILYATDDTGNFVIFAYDTVTGKKEIFSALSFPLLQKFGLGSSFDLYMLDYNPRTKKLYAYIDDTVYRFGVTLM